MMNIMFQLGQVVATPGIIGAVPEDELVQFLERYQKGDWGKIDKEDWEMNNEAITTGGRILAVYQSQNGTTFWIITEQDRSATTLLLPDEY
jgi:hypothetical protein